MRWQKAARLVIAAVVIAFAAIVAVALRRPSRPVVPASTPRESPGTIAETHGKAETPGLQRWVNPDGSVRLEVAFEKQLTFKEGRTVLRNATVSLPGRDGRTRVIRATDMEVLVAQEGGRDVRTLRGSSGVTIESGDGLEVRSAEASYDERTGIVSVPGEVQFRKGRLTGSGVGATYDDGADTLWLLDRARLHVEPEGGKDGIDASARTAALFRAHHQVRLAGDAHVVGNGRTLDAQEITVQLTPDDRFVQQMTLRGGSRITAAPGGGGAESMSARDIDLVYAADGRTLQQARLMEEAVATLAGGGGSGGKRISARTIDMTLAPDGVSVTRLDATHNVELDIPAGPDAPPRRITAAALSAGGSAGLQTATFTGGTTFRESHPAGRGAAARERTARSVRLIVQTDPGLGAIQQADFRGNVHIVDGETTAEGQRAVYRIAQDRFDITPSAGDPGPSPSVDDGRARIDAARISIVMTSRQLTAEGDVRSSLHPSKPNAEPGRGSADAGGRLPSMLEQDQPVNVTAARLEYDGAGGLATYAGDARLFQDQTYIKADTIVLDDRRANLNGRGHVQTVMFFDEVDQKTKARKPVQSTASGDAMVYDDGKRLATYTSGPTGRAHVVGSQGDVTADTIHLFLDAKANELDRAEADGAVTVKEGNRTATGTHLVYTPDTETYVMRGAPVEVEEKTPSSCRVTFASEVTFMRSAVSTVIRGNGRIPVATRPCGAGG